MHDIIQKINERWGNNPIVMRSQIVDFACGLISSVQVLKNLEQKNPNLIKGKFVFGKRKIGYPKEAVIEFLETYLHMGEDNG